MEIKKKKERRYQPHSIDESEILAIQPFSKTGFAVLPSREVVSLVCHYKLDVTR
jgi:hypothetical protein